jgi:RNA polymerase sigma-70 factor (ECF subfamily)
VRTWHANGIPDNPGAWLTTVSRNLLANHFRRQPSEMFDDTIAAPDDAAPVIEEKRSLVARAFARLSMPHRQMVRAFHLNEQPVAEIAARYGLSERAVEGRLRRARQQLRQHIESDTDTEGDPS